MAEKWSTVIRSPEYKQLNSEEKIALKDRYWNNVIKPDTKGMSEPEVTALSNRFFGKQTVSVPAPEMKPVEIKTAQQKNIAIQQMQIPQQQFVSPLQSPHIDVPSPQQIADFESRMPTDLGTQQLMQVEPTTEAEAIDLGIPTETQEATELGQIEQQQRLQEIEIAETAQIGKSINKFMPDALKQVQEIMRKNPKFADAAREDKEILESNVKTKLFDLVMKDNPDMPLENIRSAFRKILPSKGARRVGIKDIPVVGRALEIVGDTFTEGLTGLKIPERLEVTPKTTFEKGAAFTGRLSGALFGASKVAKAFKGLNKAKWFNKLGNVGKTAVARGLTATTAGTARNIIPVLEGRKSVSQALKDVGLTTGATLFGIIPEVKIKEGLANLVGQVGGDIAFDMVADFAIDPDAFMKKLKSEGVLKVLGEKAVNNAAGIFFAWKQFKDRPRVSKVDVPTRQDITKVADIQQPTKPKPEIKIKTDKPKTEAALKEKTIPEGLKTTKELLTRVQPFEKFQRDVIAFRKRQIRNSFEAKLKRAKPLSKKEVQELRSELIGFTKEVLPKGKREVILDSLKKLRTVKELAKVKDRVVKQAENIEVKQELNRFHKELKDEFKAEKVARREQLIEFKKLKSKIDTKKLRPEYEDEISKVIDAFDPVNRSQKKKN
jgi:hypothetical protein